MQLISATADDADDIAWLVRSLAAQLGADPAAPETRLFWDSLSATALAGYLASERYRFTVARDGARLAGVVALRDTTHLFNLYVDLGYQRHGLATRLWQHARQQVGRLGDERGFTVNSSLFAVPVYRRFGFELAGPAHVTHGIAIQPMKLAPKQVRKDGAD
jgi:GNAT superfamily N-acetyltransferase